MRLAEYQRKRRFDKTPEPEPDKPVPKTSRPIFVVQLHHARTRHYDFRLQVGDVLKSWAVPKGPSLDPKVKRLAAEVEDHPLSYASFEGDIPPGQYGAGHVEIFDSGVWATEDDPQAQLDKGHLKFQLCGKRLKGGWHLVRTNRSSRQPQWLLFKQKDEYAAADTEADDLLDADGTPPSKQAVSTETSSARTSSAKTASTKTAAAKTAAARTSSAARAAAHDAAQPQDRPVRGRNRHARSDSSDWRAAASALPGSRAAPFRPESIQLQLTLLVDEPPDGDEWLHEPKWDGYRILTLVQDGEVSLWSRNRLEWTHKLPDLAAALRELGLREAALDGELVAGRGMRDDFGLLQATLAGEKQGVLTYMLFDVLHLDGIDLRGVPLIHRKALLERMLKQAPRSLKYSSHILGNGKQVFAAVCEQGFEGIVSKRADAPHRDGRSDDWRKCKEPVSDEFAVVGFTPPKGHRVGFGSLLLARPDPEHGWRYAGRVGTGFSNQQLRELLKQLDHDTQSTPTVYVPRHDSDLRRARWIQPTTVVEVYYRGIGNEGLLRQPSFKTVRPDKTVEDLRDSDRGSSRLDGNGSMNGDSRRNDSSPGDGDARTNGKAGMSGDGGTNGAGAVRLTHPERVVYPDRGTTKGDVANYYITVMPWLLPEIINRPLSIIRCTQGIEKPCFFQRHYTAGLSLVDAVAIREESGKMGNYLVVRNPESLMELVQFNAIEFHPWGSTAETPDIADRIVFDLDPGPEVPWQQVVAAARQARDLLRELSLASFVRTSGGKGLHVVVPLNPGCDWATVKPFTRAVAEFLAARDPARYVTAASKDLRKGRIFIDYLRNDRAASSIASWSLRARPGAPVATPLAWEELGKVKRADAFDIDTVPQRLARLKADPWKDITHVTQDLSGIGELLQKHGGSVRAG